MALQVSEVFVSVQGEGRELGIPMTFVRLAHCNIECAWCDTPQRKFGMTFTEDDLLSTVLVLAPKDVCFTGGEPMLQLKKLDRITKMLRASGHRLHMETNGTLYPHDRLGLEVLSRFQTIAVSPKLKSAQVRDPQTPLERKPVFDQAGFAGWVNHAREFPDQVFFKFVVGRDDWPELETIVAELETIEVYVQPQTYEEDWKETFGAEVLGRTRRGWPSHELAPRVRYAPRLHTLLWGDRPGR